MAPPQPNSGLTKREIRLRPSGRKGKVVSYFVMIDEHCQNSLMEAIRQDDSSLLKKLLPQEHDILNPEAGGRLILYASKLKSVKCAQVLLETMDNCGRILGQIFPQGGGGKRVMMSSPSNASTSTDKEILSPSQYFLFEREVAQILLDRGLCQVCRIYDGTNPLVPCHHKVCDNCVRLFGPEGSRTSCFICLHKVYHYKPWATIAQPDPLTSGDRENARPYALTSADKENA